MLSPSLTLTPDHRQPSVENYKNHPDDFISTPAENVVLASIKGRREHQEDKVVSAIEAVKDFPTLSQEDQKLALELTFHQMQHHYGNELYKGSTACAVTAWLDEKDIIHVTTGNVGDSRALLVILNDDNSVYRIEPLNTLHRPTDPKEAKRIEEDGGFIGTKGNSLNRLNGILMLSRAIGDQEQFYGISPIPDVTFLPPTSLKKGQKAFVIVASDGLEEGIPNIETIGRIVSEQVKAALETTQPKTVSSSPVSPGMAIINKLLSEAYLRSNDNMLVGIIAVNTIPTAVVGCDGHGGRGVSWSLGAHFFPALQENIKLILTPQGKKEAIEILKAADIIYRSARNKETLKPLADIVKEIKEYAKFIINKADSFSLEKIFSNAIEIGNTDLTKLLVSKFEVSNTSHLLQAVKSGHSEIADILREYGALINIFMGIDNNKKIEIRAEHAVRQLFLKLLTDDNQLALPKCTNEDQHSYYLTFPIIASDTESCTLELRTKQAARNFLAIFQQQENDHSKFIRNGSQIQIKKSIFTNDDIKFSLPLSSLKRSSLTDSYNFLSFYKKEPDSKNSVPTDEKPRNVNSCVMQ